MKFILKHKDAKTFEEYITLPATQRVKMGIYLSPYALPWGDWAKMDAWLAKEYPIQFFLRNRVWWQIDLNWRRIGRAWYYLKCLVWHRYNVVKIKDLPPTWCDISHLILKVNFQLLCSYKEEEMSNVGWDESPHKEAGETINAAYKWIKIDRPALEKEIDDNLSLGYGGNGFDFGKTFGDNQTPEVKAARAKLTELETLLQEQDTKILVDIVKVRDYLWS